MKTASCRARLPRLGWRAGPCRAASSAEANAVFSDGKLRGRMKKIKEPGFFNLSWLGGKTTYTEDKWLGGEEDPRGDRGRLEDFYLDRGYVTARVGQPPAAVP